VLLILLLQILATLQQQSTHPSGRSINILNESGRRVEIHWMNPDDGSLVLQTKPDILAGASQSLSSYVGHTFEVRELPAKKSGVCAGDGDVCRVDHFTVSANQDQSEYSCLFFFVHIISCVHVKKVGILIILPSSNDSHTQSQHPNKVFIIGEGIVVEHTDSKTIATKSASALLDTCKSNAKKQLAADPDSATTILESLSACVQKGVADEIEKANEEIAFQAEVRRNMAALVENYTCADETLNTTESKRTQTWENRKVHVMIDRPASKIHVIDDFVTEEECKAVADTAEPILHDATVADGSGGSKLSESRKAKQAGIKVHWDKEADGDLIARLSRRVYDYVNHVLALDIKEDGQEDLMSIQYFGRGPDDDKPDRYMPHCDGDCTGLEFKPGSRMATIVMYCDVPEVGGATRFRNSNIHIKPRKYAATFFSYIDPVTMKMDSGFTEHSGCPVVEGTKRIVTQWVRLGVDKENPWNSFNTREFVFCILHP
jgi:hypothetical protein